MGVEISFRKLKYTIGLSSFHSYKAEFIKQEILAKMIAYNLTETIVSHTVVETRKDTTYSYKVNFTAAAHLCRIFFHLDSRNNPAQVLTLLSRKLIPVCEERHFLRLQTAQFRRPKYFLYRAALANPPLIIISLWKAGVNLLVCRRVDRKGGAGGKRAS